MEKRVKNIFNNIEEEIDLILIKNSSEPFIDKNFFYFTGLNKGLFEGCAVVLFRDGTIDLIVSELESEIASNSTAEIKIFKKKNDYNHLLKESVGSLKKIGINFSNLTLTDYNIIKNLLPSKEFIDISKPILRTRAIKEKEEIEQIRKACMIADNVMSRIPDLLQLGLSEFELSAEINHLIQKYGADKPAFDTISSFGKNCAMPHYTHGNTKLEKGDFVLCDFGACYKIYNSDITRTFVFGNANEKQIKMYKTVLDAQNIAFDLLKSGVKGCTIHNAVNSFINNTEFKDCFIHSTGHSLGIAVHDGGVGLNSECDTELQENMVLTVEPGIYINDFGGVRIEDDVLIKKDGIEILTKSSRNLIEV